MTKQEYEARSNQYDECMQLPLALEYIASLEAENATLTADNLSLVEQVNECGVKYEKLVDLAATTLVEEYKLCPHNSISYDTEHCGDCAFSDEYSQRKLCWREWLEKGGE